MNLKVVGGEEATPDFGSMFGFISSLSVKQPLLTLENVRLDARRSIIDSRRERSFDSTRGSSYKTAKFTSTNKGERDTIGS